MRLTLLLIILGLVSFGAWQYSVIEAQYAYLEGACMYIFQHSEVVK